MRKWMTGVLVVVFLCGMVGCKKSDEGETKSAGGVTAEDVARKVGEAADTAIEYARQKKKEYEAAMADELAEMDKRLGEMKEQASTAKEDVRAEMQKALTELQEKRDKARAELERIRAKAPDAWEELKAGFSEALEDLKDSYASAKERFE